MGLYADKFLMQTGVNATLPQECFMRSAFDNPSLVEHQDQIGLANGAQPVRRQFA